MATKVTLEIIISTIASDHINYSVFSIEHLTNNPDSEVHEFIKAKGITLSKDLIVHSTSWRADEKGGIILTYLVVLPAFNVDITESVESERNSDINDTSRCGDAKVPSDEGQRTKSLDNNHIQNITTEFTENSDSPLSPKYKEFTNTSNAQKSNSNESAQALIIAEDKLGLVLNNELYLDRSFIAHSHEAFSPSPKNITIENVVKHAFRHLAYLLTNGHTEVYLKALTKEQANYILQNMNTHPAGEIESII